MKAQLNKILKKINKESIKPENIKYDIVHRFCLFKIFKISLEKMRIHALVSLPKLKSFTTYYESKKKEYEQIFSTTNQKEFESSLITLIEKELDYFEYKHIFMTYIFNNYQFNFSQSIINTYILPKNVKETVTNKEEEIKKISNFLQFCEESFSRHKMRASSIMDNFYEKPDETNLIRLKNYKEIINLSSEICQNSTKITYETCISIQNQIEKDQLAEFPLWKRVLNYILNRRSSFDIRVDPKREKFSVRECVLAIYYLADYNFRRVMILNFSCSRTPLPFLYSDGRCNIAPFNGLSLKYINELGDTTKLNPFYHKSFKLSLFQSEELKYTSEELTNFLFLEDKPYFRNSQIKNHNELMNTVDVTFTTNYNSNEINCFSQLNMIMLNKQYYDSSNQNQKFIIDISNVIIFMRKSTSMDKFIQIYNHIRKYNEGLSNSTKKTLIEIVSLEKSEVKDFKIETSDSWHKIIIYERDKDPIKRKIIEFIKFQVNYYHILSNITSLETDAYKFQEHINFDIYNSEFGSIWRKIKELSDSILRKKKTGLKILRLQDFFYKAYSENESSLQNLKLTKDIEEKNRFFQAKMKKIRNEQLHYISKLDLDSPIILFFKHLIGMDETDRFAYLIYLESLLVKNNHVEVFDIDPDQPVLVVNFMREIGQIYEIMIHFINKYSKSNESIHELKPQLNKFPKLMADLFKNSYPLELLNGDLTVVPMVWLKAVLEELQNDIDFNSEIKVSVLSIMGSQSTGKSTFLNSMFNLNFPTKDGKCTRGSTALMLPVLKKDFNDESEVPDYIILIDSEGLGSAENLNEFMRKGNVDGMQLRDNKMVIFNAGLSSLCVINSFGDFDIKMMDIMRMMMFSFIRLDHCKINPLMSLVFQGRDYNNREYENLLDTSITGLENVYFDQKKKLNSKKKFRDIMRFKSKYELKMISRITDFHYYPNRYIDNVEEYKSDIFSKLFLFKKKEFSSIKIFQDKLEQLNNLLTYENYNFDIDTYMDKEKEKNIRNFLFDLKLHIRDILLREIKLFEFDSVQNFFKDKKNIKQLKQNIIFTPRNFNILYLDKFWGKAIDLGFVPYKSDLTFFIKKIDNEIMDVLNEVESELVLQEEINKLKTHFKITDCFEDSMKILEANIKSIKKGLSIERYIEQFNKIFEKSLGEIIKKQRYLINNIKLLWDYESYVKELFKRFSDTDCKEEFSHFKTANNLDHKIKVNDFFEIIKKKLKKEKFEEFPIYMKFNSASFLNESQMSFQQIHFNLINYINKYLKKNILDEFNPYHVFALNQSNDFESTKNSIIVSLNKQSSIESQMNNKNNQRKSIYFNLFKDLIIELKNYKMNLHNTNYTHYNRYLMDLILYSFMKFIDNSEINRESYYNQIKIVDDFKKKYKIELFRIFLNKVNNYTKGNELGNNIISLIKQYTLQQANQTISNMFQKKINIRLNDINNNNDLIKQVQIKFLEDSKDVTDKTAPSFVRDLMYFAFNSKIFTDKYISDIIDDLTDKNLYYDDIKKFIKNTILQNIKDVVDIISNTKNLGEFKNGLNDNYKESDVKDLIDKYLDVEGDPIKNIDNLKIYLQNYSIKDIMITQILDECIDIENIYSMKVKHLEQFDYCGKPCFICKCQCTLEKYHEGDHCSDFHIPIVFNGKYKFIDNNIGYFKKTMQKELENFQCHKAVQAGSKRYADSIFDEEGKRLSIKNKFLLSDYKKIKNKYVNEWNITPPKNKSLFWEWMALKYKKVILDLFEINQISSSSDGLDFDDLFIKNMTEDEIMNRI